MSTTPAQHAIAIVGVGAILPDAPDAAAFWQNVTGARYSISDVDPERWDPALYHDPEHGVPERTYSKIGGWVRDWTWDPLGWHLPIPPKVSDAMDEAQKWGVACTRMALADYGWPERPLDLERTAVVLGNAMAGEHHYQTSMRLSFPEIARELAATPTYAGLPADARAAITAELHANVEAWLPETTEDTMPGELGNCLAGRIANLFNLRGPNFVVDAACASAMAAMDASIEGLVEGEFDAVLTGGIDRNMSAATFIKFCAIGALSATGTRPYRDGADGFVMGEGAGLMLLKRLEDAERDGDRIYAVVRGIAGSSDGKGKGITAPNPVGQVLAVQRAWAKSGLSPAACGLIEGHGTSTRVGDVVELTALADAFGETGRAPGSIAIGSVKSNIGHLKGAAGAAGLLKAALALHHKVLPPSLGENEPNPNLDWSRSPFAINGELREWEPGGEPRVAGVSAFGFGGTNFHAVLEEHVPGRFAGQRTSISVPEAAPRPNRRAATAPAGASAKAPLRGALVLGAADAAGLADALRALGDRAPAPAPPDPEALRAPERLTIDYGDAAELTAKATAALKALDRDDPAAWKALRARGIFRGSGPAPKVAFLYTGQGSQYANMLAELRQTEPIVAATFAEADEIMRPLLDGRALSDIIFVDPADAEAMAGATAELMRTEITQPAVLTVDIALTRLLAAYGIEPDLVMGHSLGEYGALVAAGVLPFAEALEAVSARGHEMASLDVPDPGKMAAVGAPAEVVEQVIAETDGYVVLANVNSSKQVVLGGASAAVEAAVARLDELGHQAILLPVSHAFHTEIVAPASEPLRATLRRLQVAPPRIPVVANVDGGLYPTGPDAVERIIDLLGRQVASPVQFVDGLRTLWDEGARVFVETGPKRALQGFASDVLGDDEALNLMTNHPKNGDLPSFNAALCGLYAAGLGVTEVVPEPPAAAAPVPAPAPVSLAAVPDAGAASDATLLALGRVFADALERGRELLGGGGPGGGGGLATAEPVVISGAALGLPGAGRTFDETNVARLLHGEQFIDVIPSHVRHEIAGRHITRLVKGDDGQASFQEISDVADVIKLAARGGELDLEAEFGVDAGRLAALGRDTQLAIAAGIDALRDAGLPLIQHYKTTTTGSQLPDRWTLPPALRDDTGVIFASAFPGYDELVDELNRYWADHARREQLAELEQVLSRVPESDEVARTEIERHLHDLRLQLTEHAYAFDRRFLFRILSMGHSQFAELVGARGPNTQVNSACASTTQAIALAEDWIRTGRCRRVIVIAADDATSEEMLPWIGAGFLATGAAATDEVVEDAALPFDERRHGMLLGMGAAAFVVERADAARERGVTPICEVLGSVTANSAFHGTRLDVDHIGDVMERVVAQAEARGVARGVIAPETLFVSHETYTPARGGSAAAEIHALRRVFGDHAGEIVIANTKGYTGHPMGVGLEDALAVKALETGLVPAVPNFRDVDPELGELNLSKGGAYPIRYALRLAAGFGSQISMLLLRWTPVPDGRRRNPEELGYAYRVSDPGAWSAWLAHVSGQDAPELEVVQRRLRVVDRGPGATPAAAPPAAPQPVTAAPPATAPVAAPAAIPAPAPVEAPAPAPAADALTDRVMAIVAEQTGYPTDLLDPDLDLEADLGIDTVKQAEVFAAIREAWDIPRDDNLKLRDYPTLTHVIGFVRDRAPGLDTPTPTTPAAAAAEDADEPEPAGPEGFPRRVAVPVLRPPLSACAPTGVTLAEGDRVLVLADEGGVGAALTGRLEDRGVTVLAVDGAWSPADGAAQVEALLAEGPVTGVFWLPALDDEGPLEELSAEAWRAAIDRRVKLLAAVMRGLPPETFLLAATRLGGRFGCDAEGARAVLGGAVAGFTKALSREREDTLVKVVDLAPSRKTAALADLLIEETLRDPGTAEVGHADGLRWTIGLVEQAAVADPEHALTPESRFLITGAAGSIVAAITADLARAAGGGTFHLLDLVAAPDPADPDLAAFAAGRDALKGTIADRLRAAGEKPTPKMVERELARIERGRAALDALEAIAAAGGTAHWHQCDLRDEQQVAAAVQAALAGGPLDVLVHAAGLEISHQLPDKPQAEYDLVFDVKADGWFHLLRALGSEHRPRAAVVFSSIAGRFGNGGQTDYSAANELLAKSASRLRAQGTRAIAIDWTAWAGIGMASRGSIPKMMELAGIDMLPAEHGTPVVRRELTAAGPGAEVLVAGALGILTAERAPSGGADPAALGAALDGPMADGTAALAPDGSIVVTTTLDPSGQGFLHDHRIDGTAVLPGVMSIEGFAEAATALCPGHHVLAIEDVELLAPFKFYRDEPRSLELTARVGDGGDGTLVADCRLTGRRALPGQGEQETLHATARVRLGAAPPEAPSAPVPGDPGDGPVLGREAVYRVYFHGPAYQVLDAAWREDGRVVGRLASELPPNHDPAARATVTAPRLVELCFQAAGMWELGTAGRMALPTHVDRVLPFAAAEPAGPAYAVVTPREDGASDAEVVGPDGAVLVRLEGYRTIELPGGPPDDALAPIREALA